MIALIKEGLAHGQIAIGAPNTGFPDDLQISHPISSGKIIINTCNELHLGTGATDRAILTTGN